MIIGWILLDGLLYADPALVLDMAGSAPPAPPDFAAGLGRAMILAMYAYFGYYNVCYVGDEVRDPGRTIPRAVLLSAALVCVLFCALHLAMLGVISWQSVLKQDLDTYSLPADVMKTVYGPWAATAVTVLLVWSCLGAAFAGMLGYARIPYGAARSGHFFAALGRVHPTHRIPHVGLLLVGGLTLFWSFFDLENDGALNASDAHLTFLPAGEVVRTEKGKEPRRAYRLR